LLWRRRRGLATAWLVAAVGGAVLTFALKDLTHRERPPMEWRDPVSTEANLSFPSGHSLCSLVGFGMLGYATSGTLQRRRARLFALAGLAGLVLLIGFSRIYLRAHWVSDVLAGFALGGAWLAVCLTGLELAGRRLRRKRAPATLTLQEQAIPA